MIIKFLASVSLALACFMSTPAMAATPDPVIWAVGDLCDGGGGCANVARLITSDADTDGVVLAGDLAYENGTQSDFARFNSLFASKTFFNGVTIKSKSQPAPGNHEYHDTTRPCPYYFTYFGAAKAGNCTGVSWKMKMYPAGATTTTPGAWRLIRLNSNYAAEPSVTCNSWCRAAGNSTKYSNGLTASQAAAQRTFLANQCKDADANKQGAIVTFHHPALTDANYAPGTKFGRDLFSVAAANGCEIVLVGHDHYYGRWSPRNADGTYDVDGTTQFLVGTGSHSPNTPVGQTSVNEYRFAGALRLVLRPGIADFEFRNVDGVVEDSGSIPIHP